MIQIQLFILVKLHYSVTNCFKQNDFIFTFLHFFFAGLSEIERGYAYVRFANEASQAENNGNIDWNKLKFCNVSC
jgi:hypothetical protein